MNVYRTWVMGKVQAMMAYPNSLFIFLDSISEDLIQCYDCCLEEESLNYFSKRGHNYLSSKPGKDHIFIKSWRLISLLNVDLKILSKY